MNNIKSYLFLFFLITIGLFVKNIDSIQKGFHQKKKEKLLFEITEVSSSIGINHIHRKSKVHKNLKNVEPWLTSIGSSVAITDINNDGYQDFYLCSSKKDSLNHFYLNNKDGTFKNTAKEMKIADINSPYPCLRPLFFDYNNDGRQDLFLSTLYCPKIFKQLANGTFIDATTESGLNKNCVTSISSNIIDYDKDGDLDLIISGYFPQVDFYRPHTTKIMQENIIGAKNGGPTFFYRNNGDGTFTNISKEINLPLHGWVIGTSVYDFNYDGWPDLWFAIDFNKNIILLNNKKGGFKNVSSGLSHELSRSGMSADIEDIDNDKNPITYVSHIYSPGNQVKGNQFWKFINDKKIEDKGAERNVQKCGWSWGSKFIDLDNNSFSDLVVANGFISGRQDKDYWYHLDQINSSASHIISDAKNWFPMNELSLGGHQKNCIFYNKGNRFVEITNLTVFRNFRLDGRGVGKIDYKNNGSLSLIITHQNQKTLFFKNTQKNKNNWIGFRLIDKNGLENVYGALVELSFKNKTFTKQSYYNNGFASQSDPRVHFGLGKEREINKILITWPSGKKQKLTKLVINRYHKIYENDSR